MFEPQKPRYLTRGVDAEIPLALQMFLWNCVDCMPEPKDYLQVFQLNEWDGMQKIKHFSEVPEYHKEYLLKTEAHPITQKIYVIDSEAYCTMLLAEEY